MMKQTQTLFILLLLFWNVVASAQQENCATNLKKAEKLFDEGKLEQVHETLDKCMRIGFTKTQKIRAYELIIQSLLADEDYAEAERKMVRLLKMDPTYSTLKKVLSGEFVNLYEQLKAEPIVSIGFYGGPTFSSVRVSEEFGNHNVIEYSGTYKSVTNFQIGLILEFHIKPQLLFNAELALARNSYIYTLEDALPASNTTYSEDQTRFDIPLSLKYEYQIGRMSPFVQLGVSPGFVINDVATAERSYRDNSLPAISSAELDVTYKRNNLSLQGFGTIGLNYRIKRNTVFVAFRYGAGMLPYVEEEAHVDDPEFSSKYFILDDRFKLHSMNIMLGYTFSFYKLNKTVDY